MNEKLEFPKKTIFKTEIEIHVGYLNYTGHVGADSFLTIIHEARVRFLQSINCTELNIFGSRILIKNAYLEYKGEIFQGDNIICHIAVSSTKKTTADFYYSLLKNGKEICLAKTAIVFFDTIKNKISTIPVKFSDLIQ